ncbi:hypothetical protein ACP70R_033117 [Stipagrostis hirtigluma subsp. patula]
MRVFTKEPVAKRGFQRPNGRAVAAHGTVQRRRLLVKITSPEPLIRAPSPRLTVAVGMGAGGGGEGAVEEATGFEVGIVVPKLSRAAAAEGGAEDCVARLVRERGWWFLSHGAWKAPVLTPATSKPATFFGIMRFYCLGSRGSGAALMAAAVGNHREALYSLAVIQFNGSGGSKDDRAPPRRWPTAHVDALRELGHCLQQGYGLRRSVLDRRRLLIQANARELAAVVTAASASLLRAGAGGATSKGGARGHSCLRRPRPNLIRWRWGWGREGEGRGRWRRPQGSRWASSCPSSPAPRRRRAAPRTAWRGWCGSSRPPGCSSTASAASPPSSSRLAAPMGTLGRAAAEMHMKKLTYIGMELQFEWDQVAAFVRQPDGPRAAAQVYDGTRSPSWTMSSTLSAISA